MTVKTTPSAASLGNSKPVPTTPMAGFAPSKWETVDQKTVEAQAVTSKWDIFDQQLEVSIKSGFFLHPLDAIHVSTISGKLEFLPFWN